MSVFDTIGKGVRDIDKKGKLVRRKRRQKKAQKSINKGVQDIGKRAGKAGIAYLAAGGSPAGVAAATTAFVA